MRQIKGGTLNVSIVIRIIDSTDGTPETGVVAATPGLAFNYRREGAAAVAITALNNLALLTTAHTDGGILHIGDGYYRVDFQDAAFAAGATGVLLTGTATNMVVIGEYVELVAYDSADTVRLGLTSLPNAAAEAAGGLYTRGTGAGQINQDANGRADVNAVAWNELATVALPLTPTVAGMTLDVSAGGEAGIDWANIGSPTTPQNLSATNIDVDQVVASVTSAITLPTIPANWITAAGIADGAIDNATFAADVGSTAYATNIIALAADKALVQQKLDHLVAVADADDPVDNSIIAKLANSAATADWSLYVNTTDSLMAIRDHIGDGTNLTEAGGTGDQLTACLTATGFATPTNITAATGITLTPTTGLGNQTANITGNLTGSVGSVTNLTVTAGAILGTGTHTAQSGDSFTRLGAPAGASVSADVADIPTVAEMEARTPTAAQLAYIVANAATGVPVTFTTAGGSTTAAVLNQVDSAGASSQNDQYNGRLLVFTNGTLKDVVTDITAYVGGTLTATITAIPFAPTDSHTARLI